MVGKSFVGTLLLATYTLACAGPGVYASFGSAGAGIGAAFSISDRLDLRAEYTSGSTSHRVRQTSLDYDARLKVANAGLIGDYYWSERGTFRVSFGAYRSSNRLAVVGRARNGTYTIGDTTYVVGADAALTGKVTLTDGLVPYLGIGWSSRASHHRGLMFRGDLGVMGQRPRATLSATGFPEESLEAELRAEEERLRNNVTRLKVYPVVSLSAGYVF
jgi:hypothetical protein